MLPSGFSRRGGRDVLQYSPTEGDFSLREKIAGRMKMKFGATDGVEEVLITIPVVEDNPYGELCPEGIDARVLLRKCLDRDVAFVPGGSFFPNGGRENTIRFNFSNMPEERIAVGIRRVAEALRAMPGRHSFIPGEPVKIL
jgi:DNA-binding transcriptional MocR family regulator